LEYGFNGSVGPVLNPSGKTGTGGFTRTGVTEEDALHATGHDDPRAG
jgi:hypothetical protein